MSEATLHHADYVAIARRRLSGPPMPLFDDVPVVAAPDPIPLFARTNT